MLVSTAETLVFFVCFFDSFAIVIFKYTLTQRGSQEGEEKRKKLFISALLDGVCLNSIIIIALAMRDKLFQIIIE